MRKLLIVGVLMLCAFYAGLQADNFKMYGAHLPSEEDVYDGDTLTDVKVTVADFSKRGEVWPGIWLTDSGVVVQTDVRLSGIDTPERRPRKTYPDGTTRTEMSREREKALAMHAQQFLSSLIFDIADNVFIVKDPVLGKDSGRVIADIWIQKPGFPGEFLNLSTVMLENSFAKPYDGTGPRPRWD